uniref:Uncharacterized protein n=1 Tax=Anopheles melas TaxID=34690 RepID=A0A182TKY7_9DIPT
MWLCLSEFRVGKLTTAQLVPAGPILWQWTTARRLVQCNAQRKDVPLRQVAVVFLQYLVRQIATVALLHLRIVDRGDMPQIADLVRHQKFVLQIIVHVLEPIVRTVQWHRSRGSTVQRRARTKRRLREENVASLQIHVHQIVRVDVLEPFGNVQQQRAQFRLLQAAFLQHRLQAATIAVLVLDQHVVVLGPGRIVANDVVVLTQHGMGVHLVEGRLLERAARYRPNALLDRPSSRFRHWYTCPNSPVPSSDSWMNSFSYREMLESCRASRFGACRKSPYSSSTMLNALSVWLVVESFGCFRANGVGGPLNGSRHLLSRLLGNMVGKL